MKVLPCGSHCPNGTEIVSKIVSKSDLQKTFDKIT
jgi:hypothetical protein